MCENAIVDNGRIVMAEHIITTITEQDFFVYTEFYTWDRIEIKNLRTYQKNYLPKNFVKSVLNLYEKKTVLKDVEGEEINYMISHLPTQQLWFSKNSQWRKQSIFPMG